MFYTPIWEYEGYTLVQRPDTPNYFIYWTPRGRGGATGRAVRKSTRTSDLDDAKRQLVAFVRDRSSLTGAKRSAEDTPLLEVLCGYVQRHLDRQTPFVPAARTALKHMTVFLDLTGLELVSEFTLDVQRRYMDWRFDTIRREGHAGSNATINRELGVVKAAMRSAWKRGHLATVPHVELLPSPPPRDRFLRVPEVRRLLEACERDHLRLYVMLALHTLQRPIGIFGLRVEQVDLEWGRIDFLPAGSIQSNKRRPVVPITPSLRPYLETAIASSESGFVVEYLGRPVNSIKYSFRRACKRAGLEDVTPYTLRHTGATLMAAAGVPLRQIAGMLGHTETRTTEIYAKHHPDFLRTAAEMIEILFGEQVAHHPETENPGTLPALPRQIRANVA